jgi:cell fate (sporulation/competence/biofilm development) regulator YlbF (YheA/YmcA/DUF963 family)
MEEILSLAESLGNAIRESEQYGLFTEAQKKIDADEECKRILKLYNEKTAAIRDKESKQIPVEVVEKQEILAIEDSLNKNPLMQEVLRRQADYAQMMSKVNESIQGGLAQ